MFFLKPEAAIEDPLDAALNQTTAAAPTLDAIVSAPVTVVPDSTGKDLSGTSVEQDVFGGIEDDVRRLLENAKCKAAPVTSPTSSSAVSDLTATSTGTTEILIYGDELVKFLEDANNQDFLKHELCRVFCISEPRAQAAINEVKNYFLNSDYELKTKKQTVEKFFEVFSEKTIIDIPDSGILSTEVPISLLIMKYILDTILLSEDINIGYDDSSHPIFRAKDTISSIKEKTRAAMKNFFKRSNLHFGRKRSDGCFSLFEYCGEYKIDDGEKIQILKFLNDVIAISGEINRVADLKMASKGFLKKLRIGWKYYQGYDCSYELTNADGTRYEIADQFLNICNGIVHQIAGAPEADKFVPFFVFSKCRIDECFIANWRKRVKSLSSDEIKAKIVAAKADYDKYVKESRESFLQTLVIK